MYLGYYYFGETSVYSISDKITFCLFSLPQISKIAIQVCIFAILIYCSN